MQNPNDLINGYYDWLKAKTQCREVNGHFEIAMPCLDRHNDFIQVYLERCGNGWLLTDDGFTFNELQMAGCDPDSLDIRVLLSTILNHFGVSQAVRSLGVTDLEVRTEDKHFPAALYNLIEAMLAVQVVIELYTAVHPVNSPC